MAYYRFLVTARHHAALRRIDSSTPGVRSTIRGTPTMGASDTQQLRRQASTTDGTGVDQSRSSCRVCYRSGRTIRRTSDLQLRELGGCRCGEETTAEGEAEGF